MSFEPNGRQLRHRKSSTPSLRNHLDSDFKSGAGGDTNSTDEVHIIGLERIGGVMRSHPCEAPQRESGRSREKCLEKRAAHLLSTSGVTGSCRHDNSAFN